MKDSSEPETKLGEIVQVIYSEGRREELCICLLFLSPDLTLVFFLFQGPLGKQPMAISQLLF